MVQSSKKKVSMSCGCRQCKYSNGTDSGQYTQKNAERKYRHYAKGQLRKAIQDSLQELEDFDLPNNYASPYTA